MSRAAAHQLKLIRGGGRAERVGRASQRRLESAYHRITRYAMVRRLESADHRSSQGHGTMVRGSSTSNGISEMGRHSVPEWLDGRGQPAEYDALTDPCLSRFWALKTYGQKRGGTSASSFVKALVRKRGKAGLKSDDAFSGVYDTTGILRPRSSCSRSLQSRLPMSRPLSSHSSLLTVADDSADEGIEMSDLLDALSQSPTRPTSAWSSGFNGAIKATHELAVWPHHPLSLCSLATKGHAKDSLEGLQEDTQLEDTQLARDVSATLIKGK